MSLSHATLRRRPLGLPGEPPYDPAHLVPLIGKRISMHSEDDWVSGKDDPEHAYLDGARSGWLDHPEYMDFLTPDSPVYALKRMERDLYLSHWQRWLPSAGRVLDVGCGIGRFVCPLLDRGLTVYAVDPDLEALRRLVSHAAGRSGKLDVFWASVHKLPEVQVDVALSAEVLCYVPDAVSALRAIASRVVPGGRVLLSVEARYGWATSQDAPAGAFEAALQGDGLLDLPGDRWVQTYDRDKIEQLLLAAGLLPEEIVPSHWFPDGPLEDTMPAEITLEQLQALEERCRQHPVWGPLHRLWLVSAKVPA
jgi:SAM-dependent methyltransferase